MFHYYLLSNTDLDQYFTINVNYSIVYTVYNTKYAKRNITFYLLFEQVLFFHVRPKQSQGSSNLAKLHTALIKDSLQKQLEESIPASFESSLAQLSVSRDKFCNHRTGLFKTLNSSCAGIPVLGHCNSEIRNYGQSEKKHTSQYI